MLSESITVKSWRVPSFKKAIGLHKLQRRILKKLSHPSVPAGAVGRVEIVVSSTSARSCSRTFYRKFSRLIGLGLLVVLHVSCMKPFAALPADATMTVTWTANKETSVNSAGGGYRVYYGGSAGFNATQAPFIDVIHSGSSTPTSTVINNIYEGLNYVKIAAFSTDSSGSKHFSALSREVAVQAQKMAAPLRMASVASRAPASTLKSRVSEASVIDPRMNSSAAQSKAASAGVVGTDPFALSRGRHVPGEMLVKLKANTGAVTARAVNQKMRSLSAKKIAFGTAATGTLHQIRYADDQALQVALDQARLDPDIEFAQPNYIYHKLSVPNDTLYAQQWDLRNSGQTVSSPGLDPARALNNPGVSGYDMNMQGAWDIKTDCSSKVVAVIDTGVNSTHNDLAANMWSSGMYPSGGYDFVTNSSTPKGIDGHGSHVAGIIGAVGNNGLGTTGICWNAKIMGVRVLDSLGNGTTATVVAGINFAVAQGAKILNMSLGVPTFDQSLSDAVQAASNAGVIVVSAAGNSSSNNDSTPLYPCNLSVVGSLCVGAIDQTFALADYSNFGVLSVDVAAPGSNIASTWSGSGTITTVNLTSGWTKTNWGYNIDPNYGVSGINVISNPVGWDDASVRYATSANDHAYFTQTFGAADQIIASFFANYSFASTAEVAFGYKTGTVDPFAGGGTISPDTLTGDSGDSYVISEYDASGCAGGACSLGLQFTSPASGTSTGISVTDFETRTLQLNNTSYNTISGTSMASPHVAGLAALVWSQNPAYSNADVVEAIKNSGRALAALKGKSKTGRAVDAQAALLYMQTPIGLTAH